MAGELLSYTEYAQRRGCSQPRISQLVAEGRIPVIVTPQGKRIDPEAADTALASNLDPVNSAHKPKTAAVRTPRPRAVKQKAERATAPAATAPPANVEIPVASDSYNAERTRRERFLAKQAELDYKRAIGEVCEVAAATRAIMDCSVATRRLVEQIPNRIANQLAATLGVDVRRVQPMMQAEIERICDEISSTASALPEKLGATSQ